MLLDLLYFLIHNFLCTQPYIDFGVKILNGDVMSIPGIYRYVQATHSVSLFLS